MAVKTKLTWNEKNKNHTKERWNFDKIVRMTRLNKNLTQVIKINPRF